MSGRLNRILRRFGYELRPVGRGADTGIQATLHPDGKTRGRVLLSYVTDPFLLGRDQQVSLDHTQHWESLQIARSFTSHGFAVDVVRYQDNRFIPDKDYAVLVAARTNLERLARHVPEHCVKIAHLDTAHFLTNNAAAFERLLAVRERHGFALADRHIVESNWAIESADLGVVLGNDYTVSSYAYAGKPVYRLPISTTATFDRDEKKDFNACRNSYVWFGSGGFVHKGLDLVLEAFTRLPQYRLSVCGPLEREKRFCAAFESMLGGAPNVDAVGWVDVAGERYRRLLGDSLAVVFPSCAEGGGGGVITCMHGGLIPIVTEAASVDVGDFGVLLESYDSEAVRDALRHLASRPAMELRDRSRAAWEFARANHSRDAFSHRYDEFVRDVVIPEIDRRHAT